jgi:type II secretory ATPase GspE/PulE/Tfp pilus assembly ATPase PilB-like protein
MVGEIRDAKTAKTALQAAITGHLMISTLHANDTVTAVPRIIGLVEDAASFLDSVNVIIAQRLVRKICPYCIQEYKPKKEEVIEIRKILDAIPKSHRPGKDPKFFEGKGCEECSNIGYMGRIGIFEFLKVSPSFQTAVKEGATLHDLKMLAQKEGMLMMEQDGLLKAIEGVVSVSDVLNVIKE